MVQEARVLKVPRSDVKSGYVLLNVVSRGSKPLDLRLEATEGEEEYGHSLRHDKVGTLKIKNCPATDAEWQDILEKLFQQEPSSEIKISAAVETGKSIAIVVRKEIQGITQRLGEITIGVARGAEYNVLDWCATAVDAATDSKLTAQKVSSKAEELEATVADLKKQLDELITAKSEDETSLLSKFRDLLNEKKVKIRQQQKIIASISNKAADSPSPQPAPTVESTSEDKGRKAGKSRGGKRKANVVKEEEESSEDGFEPMEVEKRKSDPEDSDPGEDTDVTASTASDDEDLGQEAAKNGGDATTLKGSSQQPRPQPTKAAVPPPAPRSLPFAKAKPQPATRANASAGADSETDSDDEL